MGVTYSFSYYFGTHFFKKQKKINAFCTIENFLWYKYKIFVLQTSIPTRRNNMQDLKSLLTLLHYPIQYSEVNGMEWMKCHKGMKFKSYFIVIVKFYLNVFKLLLSAFGSISRICTVLCAIVIFYVTLISFFFLLHLTMENEFLLYIYIFDRIVL